MGEGPVGASLVALQGELGLGSSVELCGPTDWDGIRDHLAWADVLVHPSLKAQSGDREGIPNVLLASLPRSSICQRDSNACAICAPTKSGCVFVNPDQIGCCGSSAQNRATKTGYPHMGFLKGTLAL